MQVTRQKEVWSPGVRLHPKASAALGCPAERAPPKHLQTPKVPPKRGGCASTGAHPPGVTNTSRQLQIASRCCPGLLLLGPPDRSSGM